MIVHYLRVALRQLARHATSTFVGATGLALGLACFIGAWMFAAYVGSAESGFANAGRIAAVFQATEVSTMGISIPFSTGVSPLLADRLESEFPDIEAIARSRVVDPEIVTVNGKRSFRNVRYVEPAFLEIFDLPFVLGSASASTALSSSAILTESTARVLFGRTDVMGREIELAQVGVVPVTGVVSAIPEPSQFGQSMINGDGLEMFVVTHDADVFRSQPLGNLGDDYQWLGLQGSADTYLLLPADGSLSMAAINARMPGFTARNVSIDTGTVQFEVRHVSSIVADDLDSMLWDSFDMSLTGVVLILGALVLATACLNFVNLATARGMLRARESGLRKTLGARKGQLMFQHLAEGVIVAVFAAALALPVLQFAAGILNERSGLSMQLPWGAGWGFWGFVAGTTLFVGVISAAYPAFVLAAVKPATALRSGLSHAGPAWLRIALIGTQFVVASFMLIVVIVIANQNAQLRESAADMGSDTLVVIETLLQDADVDAELLRAQLMASPNIVAVTSASVPPWELSIGGRGFTLTPEDNASYRFTQSQNVGYDYFSVLEMELLAGRVFSEDFADAFDPERPTQNVIIDALAAEQFGWTAEEALGHSIYGTNLTTEPFPLIVVGVVEHRPPRVFGWSSRAFVYTLDSPMSFALIRVREDAVAEALAHIDAVWRQLAPDSPIMRSMADERFTRGYALFRNASVGISLLASFAFLIAAMGLFGMTYFLVARRRHEMGVRKVLGASSSRLFALLLRDFLRPVLIANLIAWPAAWFVAQRYVGIFIEPVAVTAEPFLLSLLITLSIAALVVVHQALRAATLHPARELRYE